ncbi:MAG: hypothetical protein M2R45_01005 [Verrucomicrobia subdivision 3 bacterium]|nr:hypothetical protein [Limisphaerales bacterium]MCS1414116.1 hypothetical protein [Limisphaerales bacterium]
MWLSMQQQFEAMPPNERQRIEERMSDPDYQEMVQRIIDEGSKTFSELEKRAPTETTP